MEMVITEAQAVELMEAMGHSTSEAQDELYSTINSAIETPALDHTLSIGERRFNIVGDVFSNDVVITEILDTVDTSKNKA